MLEIVSRRPDSLTALGHISGIGPGKIERYGKAILRALHGAAAKLPRSEAVSSSAVTAVEQVDNNSSASLTGEAIPIELSDALPPAETLALAVAQETAA